MVLAVFTGITMIIVIIVIMYSFMELVVLLCGTFEHFTMLLSFNSVMLSCALALVDHAFVFIDSFFAF